MNGFIIASQYKHEWCTANTKSSNSWNGISRFMPSEWKAYSEILDWLNYVRADYTAHLFSMALY